MSMIRAAIALLARTRERQAHIHVFATVQHEQKGDSEDGDQLADEAKGLDGHVFQRPDQVPEELWQPSRVMHQLGADVVAVVVMPERGVVAQLSRVAGRVVR